MSAEVLMGSGLQPSVTIFTSTLRDRLKPKKVRLQMSSYNKKVFHCPVLAPGILKNKTVTEGDSVSLSCKIQSSDLLFVR